MYTFLVVVACVGSILPPLTFVKSQKAVLFFHCRQSNRVSASVHRRDLTIADDFQLADSIDGETEISREWIAGVGMFSNSLRRDKINRPPGLTKAALESLHVKIFCNLDQNNEAVPRVIQECGICLEAFLEGDKLICLPCGHRFHNGCLVPWVQTCGDCPYCRAGISLST